MSNNEQPVCTGNCKIKELVTVAVCETCGWIDEPPVIPDPYDTKSKNEKSISGR